jgi:ABC-2 type transport system permease protein
MEAQMVSFGLLQAFFSSQGPELAPAFTTRALELAGMPPEFHDRVMALSRGFSSSIGTLFGEAEALPDESAAPAAGDDGPDFSNVMSDLIPVEREDVKPPDRPKELTYQLAQSVSGIAVMMLMFGLVACGTMLIQEREEGTLQRLLLTPAPRHALLFGKFLFAIVVGAIQLVVMFIIGGLVFRVNFLADPVALLVISAVVLVSITSFGMLVAGFARTTKQAEGLSTLVILVMSALGGAWFPIQMIPLPLVGEIVTRCTLTWWAMDAYQSMLWHGKPWTAPNVLIDLGVLLLFALAATLLAVRLFRSRYLS